MEARPLTLDEVKNRLPVKVSERALRAKIRKIGWGKSGDSVPQAFEVGGILRNGRSW